MLPWVWSLDAHSTSSRLTLEGLACPRPSAPPAENRFGSGLNKTEFFEDATGNETRSSNSTLRFKHRLAPSDRGRAFRSNAGA
jgi:hypothetical protein